MIRQSLYNTRPAPRLQCGHGIGDVFGRVQAVVLVDDLAVWRNHKGHTVGWRNVASEYFIPGAAENFIDLDAFTVGAVLSAMAALFDRYWTSRTVYPLDAIAKHG